MNYRTLTRSAGPLAFTLLEMVVTLATISLLLAATMSVVALASHAMPARNGMQDSLLENQRVLDELTGDLIYATAMITVTKTEVEFVVADRGHGESGAEIIRYAWSGTPGDPLTRQYNRGTVASVLNNVQNFSVLTGYRTSPLVGNPRVLLVVDDDVTPNGQDAAKQALIESWGFTVKLAAAKNSLAEFTAAMTTADVMYISNQINTDLMRNKSLNPAMGIVAEDYPLYNDLGLTKVGKYITSDGEIWISNNSHEITRGFAIGHLAIFDSQQGHLHTNGALAPNAQMLPQWPPFDPMTVTLDAGARRYDGRLTRGRRVKLPWGDKRQFDFTSLNDNGKLILRRSLAWAAAPIVYDSIRIGIQRSNPTNRVEAQTLLLNCPDMP